MMYVPPSSLEAGELVIFSIYGTVAQKRRFERYLLYYHLGQMWLQRH